MARRAAHSTEELKDIIRDYLDTNVSFHKLTATELARYCKTKLNISDITYQSFTRNKEVNEWICEYNSRLPKQISNWGECMILPENLIDVDDAIIRYRRPDDLKNFLYSINNQISELVDLCHKMSDQTQKSEKDLIILRNSNSVWKKKLDEVLSLLEKSKTEKHELEKMVHDMRRERDFVRKYLDEYLYEPAIRSHLNEIGMLLEDESQNINTRLTVNESEQFYKEIMDFYNVMESEADSFIKGEIEAESSLKVEIKNEEKQDDILTEKTVNLLEKYSRL